MSKTCGECMYLDYSDSQGSFFIKYRCGHVNRYVSSNNAACGAFMLRTGRGGCYLTTACIKYQGLDDDCFELNTLRAFRDNYIAKLENGKELIDRYYANAPIIVEQIDKSLEREFVYNDIFLKIQECIQYIKSDRNEKALQLYIDMSERLYNKFVRRDVK